MMAEKDQQIINIEAEARKIKEEYYLLMAENGEIKEEKAKITERAKGLLT